MVQWIGQSDQAVEPLDDQECRFEETRFVFVHGLAHVAPQSRVGPVRIVSTREAHVPNRAERLKLFGLLDHLNTA
jgi:hypothetical protein